tara:strand:+ start:4522 stop:5952 length:1431 start_codon:yes stop_codon:yes gene_type:complete
MPVTHKKRTRCPNGWKKDPETNGCIPKGTQKTKKTRSRCPNGQRKNPKTGKCESKTKNINVIRLPKTMKRKTVVRIKKTPAKTKKKGSRCPNGQRKNPKTGKCEAKTKSDKKEATVIADTTPIINKIMQKKVALFGEYSPSINKHLKRLKSLSPVEAQGCGGSEIRVKLLSGTTKCYNWNSKTAQKIMLDNLLSKKPIDCTTVTAPKQFKSNCWFNSFFMVFFISDMGRKFNRWLREAMITGKLADGRSVKKVLRRPLFVLNKYINASLRSSYDTTNFADLMDTNNIIEMVFSAVGRRINNAALKTVIAPVDVPSNPLRFYKALYYELGGELMKWLQIRGRDSTSIKREFDRCKHEKIAKIVYLEIHDNESKSFKKPRQFVIKKKEPNGYTYNYTYTLDSAVLRNTAKHHFSAYITCNGKDYGFDGESFSRMQPFNWKTKLNRNSQWRFADQYDTYFNFTKGYQLLIYYITEVKRV